MNANKDTIKVGSRKSQLALIQTNYVISQLQELYPKKTFEIVKMSTMGDKILDKPLPKIGEKSLFTKELEIALEQQDVDFVVHSLKDLPTTLPDGMCIGAIGKREDPRDAVVLHEKYKGNTLHTLPKGSTIGTSSLRRTAQLHKRHPHLHVVDIRGNLNTRLAKLDKGDCYSAIVLAAAGLFRMGWSDRLSQNLEPEEMLYAVGQGALAVECREDDFAILRLLESLQHGTTTLRCLAERSFLKTLGGGCSAPVAVQSELSGPTLSLTGAVWSLDGKLTVQHSASTPVEYTEDDDGEPARKCPYRMPKLFCSLSPGKFTYHDLEAAEKLGQDVAMQLVDRGALDIMSDARQHIHGLGDENSQLESLFHLVQTKLASETCPYKPSRNLPNETPQNKPSHSLPNETHQNKPSHSRTNETPQNKPSHSLPNKTPQNKPSHHLLNKTLQNYPSQGLPDKTIPSKLSLSLSNECPQNKSSNSLHIKMHQNKPLPCFANIDTCSENGTKECSSVIDHRTILHDKFVPLCSNKISAESTNGGRILGNGIEHASISLSKSDANNLREVASTNTIT